MDVKRKRTKLLTFGACYIIRLNGLTINTFKTIAYMVTSTYGFLIYRSRQAVFLRQALNQGIRLRAKNQVPVFT